MNEKDRERVIEAIKKLKKDEKDFSEEDIKYYLTGLNNIAPRDREEIVAQLLYEAYGLDGITGAEFVSLLRAAIRESIRNICDSDNEFIQFNQVFEKYDLSFEEKMIILNFALKAQLAIAKGGGINE